MTMTRVEAIANTVLYEGYMLYPYRPSAVKNRQRFNFGVVVPEAKKRPAISSEISKITTECLLQGESDSRVCVEIRFLQLVQRDVEVPTSWPADGDMAAPGFSPVDRIEIDGQLWSSWHEAVERRLDHPPIEVSALCGAPLERVFLFEGSCDIEPVIGANGILQARLVRRQKRLSGLVRISARKLSNLLFRLTCEVRNTSPIPLREGAGDESFLISSLISTHSILRVELGEFISLTDPPETVGVFARQCSNVGTWPVLAGETVGVGDVLLSSPIILPDYPEIAPESAGDLFDGTEIDEILALRILTMTDEEKREMRSVDERTRAILERTESLPSEHFMNLHGAMRTPAPIDVTGKEPA